MNKQIQIAYCAGIFDGEGCVTVHNGCIRLSVGMIDREPLNLLHSLFGGKLYGPRKGTNAPMYYWQLPGWKAVEGVYALIGPYLCARRRGQFEKAFKQPRAEPRIPVKRPPPCGFDSKRTSNAGHVAHYKRGEKACADCYEAALRYMRQYRKESQNVVK